MNKIETLEECLKLWKELAKNGKNLKPAWARSAYTAGCPVCSYMRERFDALKRKPDDGEPVNSVPWIGVRDYWCNPRCLLRTVWGGPNGCLGEGDSPYRKWDRVATSVEERKAYALEIVKGTEKILKRLKSREAKAKKG